MSERSLNNVDMASAKQSTPDIEVAGNPGAWVLICKASSKKQGWMKSTKAMDVPGGCLVQVTTEHRNPHAFNVVTACAEAVTFVPGGKVRSLQQRNKAGSDSDE